jgi:hypothetical protein
MHTNGVVAGSYNDLHCFHEHLRLMTFLSFLCPLSGGRCVHVWYGNGRDNTLTMRNGVGDGIRDWKQNLSAIDLTIWEKTLNLRHGMPAYNISLP